MFYKATHISKAFFPCTTAQVGSKKFGPKTFPSLIAELDSSLIPCHHLYTIRCWIKSSFMKSVDICCSHAFNSREKRKFICTHRSASK